MTPHTSCVVFKNQEEVTSIYAELYGRKYGKEQVRRAEEGEDVEEEEENALVLVSACERSTVFDPVLACVTMALLCVTMVLTCEIPHTRYPVDPGTTPTAQISDLPPKYVTEDEPGRRRRRS